MVQEVTPVQSTRLPGRKYIGFYLCSQDSPGNPDKVCLEIEKNGGQSFPLAASVEDTNAIMGAV